MPSKEKERTSDKIILIQIREGNVKVDERQFVLNSTLARLINVDLLSAPSNISIKQYNKERDKIKEIKEFFSKYA
jgi:hypothetical protein